MAGKRGRAIYGTRRWASVRAYVLDRDGWRCRGCGRPGRLEVHHVAPLADGGDAYDAGNLETRCLSCHFAEHKRPPADKAAWIAYSKGAMSGAV